MTIRVIGAGFGRTGTLSLKFALEKLGFDKCYHMMEVMNQPEHRAEWSKVHRGESIDWQALLEGFQATVDWPSCNFWREQMAQYPDARVILSLRDPERWYDSVMNTIYKSTTASLDADDPAVRYGAEWAHTIIWDAVFDGRMDDKDHVIRVFNEHNESVKAEVPPDKLLVFEAADGWAPLCEFLEVPVPDEPYPRVNTTEEFTERWQKIRKSSS